MAVALPPPGPLPSGGLRVPALGGLPALGRPLPVFAPLGRLLLLACGVL
ncbi:hypothetical protein, partial [Mycobacterium tuberculosis]